MASHLYRICQFNKLHRASCSKCTDSLTSGRLHPYSQSANSKRQAIPHTGFYADILEDLKSRPIINSQNSSSAETPVVDDDRDARIQKARVVFGSRLLGPAERREQIDRKSKLIAGVLVPPRPLEPDNCCMSGCVNCVWDRYGDELEEWAMKSKEARARLEVQNSKSTLKIASGGPKIYSSAATCIDVSVDDDGGGSEGNWGAYLGVDEEQDLLKDVPIGIREFMKTEKLLKQKRQMESNSSQT